MKPPAANITPVFQMIMTITGIVVIIGGMMHATVVLIPLMMATFIAIVCSGPIFWFQKKGVPEWLALILVMTLVCCAVLLALLVVGSSVKDFIHNVPEYETKLQQQMGQFSTFLAGKGVHLKGKGLNEILKPSSAMKYAELLFNDLSTLLANGFVVLFIVIFMLLEAKDIPVKLKAIYGDDDKKHLQLQKFNANVRHYMAIKTVVSLITGALVSLCLLVIGVDYAIMWGMLAFAFNFIPNIGSIIAAVPAVLLAMVQLGPGSGLTVTVCYLVINMVIGNVAEPRFMGKGLGISTLVVFLSLLFWGWVLGPVGMFLSVVLTIKLKILLESSEETQWLALLLGSSPTE